LLSSLALTVAKAHAETELSRGISIHVPFGRPALGRLAACHSTALARFRGGGSDWRELAASISKRVPPALLLFSSATGAFSGAMRGGVEQMDVLGSTLLGVVAGVGGGMLRDLLLGVPAYWTYNTMHLYLCVVTALATFMLLPHAMRLGINDKHLAVLYADAAALASGAVVGAHIGHARTGDPVVTLAVGAVTALSSGVIVDVICMQRPRVLTADYPMYAAPALAGIGSYIALVRCDLPQSAVVTVSFLMAMGLRALAWTYRLRLPRWKAATPAAPRAAPLAAPLAAPPVGLGFDRLGAASGETAIKPEPDATQVALTTRAPDGKT
jgi:uncharacterized membrane protein YeiH